MVKCNVCLKDFGANELVRNESRNAYLSNYTCKPCTKGLKND